MCVSIVFSDFAHTGRPWNRSSKNSSTARWILAPFFLGLSLALLALALKFFHEVWHVLPHVFELSESDLILSLLAMVDMGLVGGLIVMVMFSSYENFVSRLDLDEKDSERLGWLGKMDAGSLKNKVASC